MIPISLFLRFLLPAAAQASTRISSVFTNAYLRPFAVEGITRLAVREGDRYMVHLSTRARPGQSIQLTAKQTSGVLTKQARTITDIKTVSRRSRFRTGLIVTLSLTQFLVAWKWPLSKWSVFDGYGDDDEYSGFNTIRPIVGRPTEAWSIRGITLPLLPCRWRHCCECEHLGITWCTKNHQNLLPTPKKQSAKRRAERKQRAQRKQRDSGSLTLGDNPAPGAFVPYSILPPIQAATATAQACPSRPANPRRASL